MRIINRIISIYIYIITILNIHVIIIYFKKTYSLYIYIYTYTYLYHNICSTSHELFTFRALKPGDGAAVGLRVLRPPRFGSGDFGVRAPGAPRHHQIYGGGLLGLIGLPSGNLT